MAIVLAATATQAQGAGTIKGNVYVFGFAASFNDSTVYLTDIQEINGARINGKSKFLENRSSYSYQLQDYLKTLGVSQPTCITSYATDRKTIEKKYARLKKKYTEKGKQAYDVRYIAKDDFTYKAAEAGEGIVYVDPTEGAKAARKSEMKARNGKRKDKKKKNSKE